MSLSLLLAPLAPLAPFAPFAPFALGALGALGALPLQGDPAVVPYKEHSFTLKLPPLESLEKKDLGEHCAGEWLGKYKGSDVHFRLYFTPNEQDDFVEPDDVVEGLRDVVTGPDSGRAPEDVGTKFSFGGIRPVAAAAAGTSPIVAVLAIRAWRKEDPKTEGLVVLASGLLASKAWLVRLDAWPAPAAEDATALVASVEKCAAYEGKPREAKWTDDEALAYWKKFAPPGSEKKFEKPLRSEHFIVLTNSTSPGPYAKKLETKYAAIKKILPFEEAKGRRLLPIVLFRTEGEFQTFYRHVYKMETKEDVHDGSLVLDRYLATSCDNDDDYEDMLDLMRLCLWNRQHAQAGGRWFQNGLRTYAATKPKERFESLHAVKSGKFTPLETLLDEGSWAEQDERWEKRGATKEADFWEQSALWMEFFHDGPFPKDAFQRFVETVGAIPEGQSARVKETVESIYGADVASLQKKWVEYFAKR
jgi:hypothetical protein